MPSRVALPSTVVDVRFDKLPQNNGTNNGTGDAADGAATDAGGPQYEFPTEFALWRHCNRSPSSYALYFHTKVGRRTLRCIALQ